jgi:hypothetical protein
MVSFKAQRGNSKLTDFADIKDYVVRNSVRSIPRTIKTKTDIENSLLSSY